jgi:cytochrome c oxidase assembly factor CtaG
VNSRLATLCAGLIALWIAVASPAAHIYHHLLTGHMVQHLLLMVVAAPLISIASCSKALLGRSLPTALCWLAGSLTVIFWHVPAVLAMTLRSHYWHGTEQISFFVAGILFWAPAMASTPRGAGWSVPVYLFLATLPCDALSAYLVFCGHIVYPSYGSGGQLFRLSPLDDQALAGALMWVVVTFAYLIPAIVLSARLLSNERTDAAELGVA